MLMQSGRHAHVLRSMSIVGRVCIPAGQYGSLALVQVLTFKCAHYTMLFTSLWELYHSKSTCFGTHL